MTRHDRILQYLVIAAWIFGCAVVPVFLLLREFWR